MVKFHARYADGRKIIGIGINKDDVERMQDSGVMRVSLEDIGAGHGDVIMMYGDSDEEIHFMLDTAGVKREEGCGAGIPVSEQN